LCLAKYNIDLITRRYDNIYYMNKSNGEREIYDETSKSERRAKKASRKKYPRDRSFVGKEIKKIEKQAGDKKRRSEAIKKIEKHLRRFPSPDTPEGEKQLKTYTRWVKDSLNQNYPLLYDGDIKIKTAVASVKAGGQSRQKSRNSVRAVHTPTLIGVRNEEERSLEQNTLKAKENLYKLLVIHLQLWKTLNITSPSQNVEKELNQILK